MRFLISFVAAAVMALPVAARPLTEGEAASLQAALTSYKIASVNKHADQIVATIPPRIVNVFAGTAGIEASQVTKTLVSQTEAMLKTTKITDFVYAPGPYEAKDEKMADGTAIVWAVVPTQFVSEADGKKTLNHQPLLALSEGGKWYFSRVDGPQQQQMVAFAYPFIAQATLPASSAAPTN